MEIELSDFFLRDIDISKVTSSQWSKIISQGRSAKMLGRLCWLLMDKRQIDSVPQKVKIHLLNAKKTVTQQNLNLRYELIEISKALNKIGTKPILLKGAAYALLNLDCSIGRTYNDIDLLVKKDHLEKAEVALMTGGWLHKSVTAYDREYYRRWMHEIQPMIHVQRFSVIDLHHNILPKTNKFQFDINLLNFESVFVNDEHEFLVLSPIDRFIHSALHLFTESEISTPLRDITDLSLLLDDLFYTKAIDSIDSLTFRAKELGITEYIDLALFFCSNFSKNLTKLPDEINERVRSSVLNRLLLIPAYRAMFLLINKNKHSKSYSLYSWVIYMRGHLHRMPLRLLIPHLIKKSLMKKQSTNKAVSEWINER